MLLMVFWASLGLILGALGAFLGALLVFLRAFGGTLHAQNFFLGSLPGHIYCFFRRRSAKKHKGEEHSSYRGIELNEPNSFLGWAHVAACFSLSLVAMIDDGPRLPMINKHVHS